MNIKTAPYSYLIKRLGELDDRIANINEQMYEINEEIKRRKQRAMNALFKN